MKIIFSSVLIVLYISISNLKAQEYFINFKGTGESSIVSRVKVENLNQGTAITIKGTDILYLLGDVSSVDQIGPFKNDQIIFAPNPTATSSRMRFFLPEAGNTLIDLYDYAGRKVAQTQDLLTRGIHTYLIQGLERGITIVSIKSDRFSYRGKLVCTSSATNTPEIAYENTTVIKDQESISMQYNTGDRLKFTGYSGKYSTIVVEVPAASSTIGFNFIACTDADENNYPIVRIGTQNWMAENLRTIKYKNGDLIPVIKENIIWGTMTGPGCCWYNNNIMNLLTYGALYNWKCVTDERKVCPVGWHVPAYEEWTTLITFLGGESMAGDKLRETGKANWSGANSNATNESGFSAIPNGFRNPDGRDTMFFGLGESANWWSSSQANTSDAWYWTSYYLNNAAPGSLNSKKAGLSLRCIEGEDQVVSALSTKAISDITTRTAISGGIMTSNNSSTVMIRGVCWNTSGNPTTDNSLTSESTGRRNFSTILTGLEANTTYYVRAYAVSSTGTAYGNEVSFTTNKVTLANLITTAVSSITSETASSGGNITDDGGGSITARGVCWATTSNPTITDNKTTDGTGTGSFTSNLLELQPGTMYHVRSYSTNSVGTSYGNDLTFTTDAVVPTVVTAAISEITTRTAISGGNISSNGGSPVTVRGICWSTLHNPTIANSITTDGSGSGSFTSNMNSLDANTKYYVRAYAVNSVGTAYGNEVAFTSEQVVLANVTTATVSSITSATAISGGNVTNDGGGSITLKGVCWATTSNPTTSDNKTSDGTGTGSFTSNISGLQPGTIYHVRSYSTNSAGTSYGNDLTFTTAAVVPTVMTAAISGITQRTAISGGNITSNGGSSVTARGVCWSTLHNPTTANSKTSDGSGSGSFISNMNSLDANTTYYVRAYAVNSVGTAYGNEVAFTSEQVVIANVTTVIVSSITSATAISGGTITDDGGGSITARGVCWATASNPATGDNRTTDGTGTGSFTSNLSGLQPGTTYHVRSYAINSAGTAYGNDLTFTTLAVVPTVLTAAISGITSGTAISGGNITSNGGSPVTSRGVCWSTSHNPTTANSRTSNGSGSGSFTSNLNVLDANTTYYVRAYAVNNAGTAYGNEVSFTTDQAILANLTTTIVSSITSTTAISGGNITADGGGSITARGVCWATTSNPSTSNNRTTDGTGTGSFTSNLSGLQPGTTYHVRSYAINSAGTAYGNDLTFTTLTAIPTVSTVPISGITQITAISGGNISLNGGSPVTSRGICWSTLHNPTTANSRTSDGSGSGSFTSNLTVLDTATTYYVRAYAVNNTGTAYGNEISFTTLGATPPDMINGLAGYWNLNEASGNALDQTGAHTGIPFAVSRGVTGKIGNAYNFSKGSRSYINCGAIPLTTNSFSLWAKRTASSSNVCIIGFGSDRLGLWIGAAGNIVLCNNSGVAVATWGRLTETQTYHHIVLVTSATGTSGKAELFVDGISQGEKTCSTSGITNFVIGSNYAGGAFNSLYSFDGSIDEVGLWNRALTLPEIGDLYSQGLGHTYPFTGVLTNDANFFLMADASLLLHSVGNKRVIIENVGSDRYLKFSSDNGVSYSSSIIVPSDFYLRKARILGNGNIVLFGTNKIYYSDDDLATIHPCNVLDKNGNAYTCHVPVNIANPGAYFHFMGGFVENAGVAVLGNYTSSAFGASPVNLYYSLDGITWKVFYTFGQNPDYTDDGTVDGGTGGIMLGDPGNPLIARHIHSVNIGEDGNYYASSGDNDGENHILKCTYNKTNDTWSTNDLLNATSSTWQRMRTLGIFERNGYYIWGSDGPGTFTFGGVTYQCYGIYKCRVADINDPSKHILLQPLSDACYSFVNVGKNVFAGMMSENNVYISYDYGETWSSYPKSSWMAGNIQGVWYNELYKYFENSSGYIFSSMMF